MRPVILTILLFAAFGSFAQSQPCDYTIDSVKVLNNQNLKALVDSLQTTQLTTLNNKSNIPQFLKRTLNCWTGGFDIANPNQPFQATDVVHWRVKTLPRRQLTYLGLNDHFLLLAYKQGGKALSHHIIIFRFNNNKVIDFWTGKGGEFKSKEEVLYYLKNFKENTQSGFIYL